MSVTSGTRLGGSSVMLRRHVAIALLIALVGGTPDARAADDAGAQPATSSRRKPLLIAGLLSVGTGAALLTLSLTYARSEPVLTDESRRQIQTCLQNPSPLFGTRGCREDYYPHEPAGNVAASSVAGAAFVGLGIVLLRIRASSRAQIQIGPTYVVYRLRF